MKTKFNQFNESVDTSKILKYQVSEDVFKERGYTFQKLYAAEYPVYHKKVGDYHIWCWVNEKEIVVKDWHGFLTPTIIKYYFDNKDDENKVRHSAKLDWDYMKCYLDRDTGEIVNENDVMKDIAKNYKEKERLDAFFNTEYKTKPWNELVIGLDGWKDYLIPELNILTDGKLKELI